MEKKSKKSVHYYMRVLHRNVGFFIVGLALIFGLSGITLIFRDTDFLKHEVLTEKKLSPNLELPDVGKALRLRNIKALETEGQIIHFQNGTYNKETGIAKYTSKELPKWLHKFTQIHKSSSRSVVHWFTTIFGILFLFLVISSFWMFKPNTKMFRKGMIYVVSGIVFAVILLLL